MKIDNQFKNIYFNIKWFYPLLILLMMIIYTIQIFASGSSKEEYNVTELYKSQKYKDIIEISVLYNFDKESEKLLLAKSYEKLGFYKKANRIYKDIYRKDSDIKDIVSFFIAKNYENHDDIQNAIKWYSISLVGFQKQPGKYQNNKDKICLAYASFECLKNILNKDKKYANDIIRLLKKFDKMNFSVNYYLGYTYQKIRNLKLACICYMRIFEGNNPILKKRAIDELIKDYKLLQFFEEKGIDLNKLANLFLVNENYYEALVLSYYVQYNLQIAKLRALCYYKLGDYKTAAVIYNDFYASSKEPDALLKIAYSYYNINKKDRALYYLDRYIKASNTNYILSREAFYLKLQLDKGNNNIKEYIHDVDSFVKIYYNQTDIDKIVYDTFYYLLQIDLQKEAVSFLERNSDFIKDMYFKSWASYILGIYLDESYYLKVINQFTGNFYYYSVLKKLNPKKTYGLLYRDILKTADRYLRQKKYDNALEIYISLYSFGIQKEYAKKMAMEILGEKHPYKIFFDIEKVTSERISSTLFYLYKLGLYDEAKDLIIPSIIDDELELNCNLYYYLSKISYDVGDIVNGIRYAEKMIGFIDKKYLIFFPENILKLLYPFLYEDIINNHLEDKPSIISHCFVLSIIREESRYNPRARSNMGAIGLMQLMPDTAGWIIKKRLKPKDLYDTSTNVGIGIKYLYYLEDRFDSSIKILAAYNGGPTNARRWLNQRTYYKIEHFIEEIPYKETRDFVKKVLTSFYFYNELYKNRCF